MVQSGYTGQPLFQTLTQSVGYLNGKGYCSGSNCHQFPIVVGETGSALTDPRDTQFYTDFQSYIQNTGAAQDGAHTAIDSLFWWSWNENSVGTCGFRLHIVGENNPT